MIEGVSVEKLSSNVDGDSTSNEFRPRIDACEKWVVMIRFLYNVSSGFI